MVVLSAIDYAKQVLNATGPKDPNLVGTVNGSEFRTGKYDGAFFFVDYSSNHLYFYHPLYAPTTPATAMIAAEELSYEAQVRLSNHIALGAPQGHAWANAAQVRADISLEGLALVVIGIAIVAVAGYFSGGAALAFLPDVFWTILAGAGVAVAVGGAVELTLGGVASGLNALFNPQPVGSPVSTPGGTCQQYDSPFGGCYILCVKSDGTSSTQQCPGGGGVGGALVNVAIGVGALAGVGIGSYVLYRYVRNRPRPGFGSEPGLGTRAARYVETYRK